MKERPENVERENNKIKSFILMLICLVAVIVQITTKDYFIVICILYFYVIINSSWNLFKK